MSDVVAVALITGFAGVSASITTYFATRRQADASTSTELARIQAELDRLKIQHGEDHARHRAVLYHELLDILGRWHIRALIDPMEQSEYAEWLLESEHCLIAVMLFGTQPVYESTRTLQKALEDAWEGGSMGYKGSTGQDAVVAALLNATTVMRTDTAPDQQ
jgi:hypothetical protein